MFAFLRKLAGVDADLAIRERDAKLSELNDRRQDLTKLSAQLKKAQAAAASRVAAGSKQRDNLQQSQSGSYRLKLDSST